MVLTPGTPSRDTVSGIADLIFDVLRRTAHPLREDDLLVLADVRDRIDGNRIAR